MKIINIIDEGCDRYTIKSDCYCLGRQWDNLSEQMQIVVPEREKDHTCTMIVSADGVVIDHLDIKDEPKDITNVLSRHLNIEISFTFTGIDGYVKNSEIKSFYFSEARKPEEFIPSEPEQSSKLDIVLGNAFIRADVEDDILRFYNSNGDVAQAIPLPTVGGGGGVTKETDPTVPQYVKDITKKDIAKWDSKGYGVYVGSGEMPEGYVVQIDPSGEADDFARLEKTLQDILAVIQGGQLNENQISDIEQLIVSYFENKTVEEVER